MLDFTEVGRRIERRNGERPAQAVTHEYVVSPLIGQLLDPDYLGENGVLLAPHECHNLAITIQRQAQLLDRADVELEDAEACAQQGLALCEALSTKLKWARVQLLAVLGTSAYIAITVAIAWLI